MNEEDFPPLSSPSTAIPKAKQKQKQKQKKNHVTEVKEAFNFQQCHQALFMSTNNSVDGGSTDAMDPSPLEEESMQSTNTSQPFTPEHDSLDEFYGDAIEISLTGSTIQLLENLFGDGSSIQEELTPLMVPTWMGEYLYRLSKNLEVPDYFSSTTTTQPVDDYPKSPTTTSTTLTEEDGAYKVESLNQLYDIFCTMDRGMIRSCARSHEYDFNETFNELLEASSMEPIPMAGGDDSQSICIIKTSCCPQPIKPPEAEKKVRPPPEYFYDPLKNSHSMAEVDELRAEAAALFRQKREHQEMAKNSKHPSIASFYYQRAKECEQQASQVLAKSDLILLGINSHEPVIDLHYLNPKRAKELLALKIDFIRDKYPHLKQLQVITGWGKTLQTPSTVKSSVISYLNKQGISNYVDPTNKGVIIVTLTEIKERLSS